MWRFQSSNQKRWLVWSTLWKRQKKCRTNPLLQLECKNKIGQNHLKIIELWWYSWFMYIISMYSRMIVIGSWFGSLPFKFVCGSTSTYTFTKVTACFFLTSHLQKNNPPDWRLFGASKSFTAINIINPMKQSKPSTPMRHETNMITAFRPGSIVPFFPVFSGLNFLKQILTFVEA